ncbi:hypothetical protein FB451DRAFT_208018 [Mycena latifolia]|nr:hypothetical protein FB451DRAFT_208018 [Mycena latifolia]
MSSPSESSPRLNEHQLRALTRREIQALAKKENIKPANSSSVILIKRLLDKFYPAAVKEPSSPTTTYASPPQQIQQRKSARLATTDVIDSNTASAAIPLRLATVTEDIRTPTPLSAVADSGSNPTSAAVPLGVITAMIVDIQTPSDPVPAVADSNPAPSVFTEKIRETSNPVPSVADSNLALAAVPLGLTSVPVNIQTPSDPAPAAADSTPLPSRTIGNSNIPLMTTHVPVKTPATSSQPNLNADASALLLPSSSQVSWPAPFALTTRQTKPVFDLSEFPCLVREVIPPPDPTVKLVRTYRSKVSALNRKLAKVPEGLSTMARVLSNLERTAPTAREDIKTFVWDGYYLERELLAGMKRDHKLWDGTNVMSPGPARDAWLSSLGDASEELVHDTETAHSDDSMTAHSQSSTSRKRQRETENGTVDETKPSKRRKDTGSHL